MVNQGKTEIPEQNTVIGEATCVRGTLSGATGLVVQGRIEGQVRTEGSVVVEQTGVVKAGVVASSVIIKGVVVGDIVASQSIQIEAEGRVVGNVSAPRFSMAEGALYRGHVETDENAVREMIGDAERLTVQPMAVRSPAASYQRSAVQAAPAAGTRRISSAPRASGAMPVPPPPAARVTFKPVESKAPRTIRPQPPAPPAPPAPFQTMLLHDEEMLPGMAEDDLAPVPAAISKRKGAIKARKQ